MSGTKRDPATGVPDFWQIARDWLHAYLPTVRGASGRTIEAYRIGLESYVTFLADLDSITRDKVCFDHFDRSHVKAWITWMGDLDYKPTTIALRLTTIRMFLAYAGVEDATLMALRNQVAQIRPEPIPKRPIEYLQPDETRALLTANTGRTVKSRRNRMLLILLYDTGARVSEITTLTLAGLHLGEPGHATLAGKRNKTRIVPLGASTVSHLRVYLDEFHPGWTTHPDSQPLFYSWHAGVKTPLSVDTIQAVLKQAANTARASGARLPDDIHCHTLRKTKAMDLYQAGVPMPIIMRLLGHENINTTNAFYAFATIDMMRQAINKATPPPTTPTTPPDEATIHALYTLR